MSSTGVDIGHGTLVRVGVGDPVAWTELVGVGDVDFPMAEADEVEVTHQGSPGRAKEFIAGLTDNGVVAVPVHWIPGSAQDVVLRVLQASGETIQVEYTDNTDGAAPELFAGFVKGYKRTAPVGDKMMAEVSFRLNGAVV
jgi:hypothetical protein